MAKLFRSLLAFMIYGVGLDLGAYSVSTMVRQFLNVRFHSTLVDIERRL